eukprot:TRINITY_DN2275_c0_g1_i1.p1 TRINITY_DN2275_c0_g1~~TRINITY_DN2275_c0_g1_i1.p1  ORF type:complete len:597 (-),score=174.44 TRINITY_DN2275_c0_g1_i1:192-1982(-)
MRDSMLQQRRGSTASPPRLSLLLLLLQTLLFTGALSDEHSHTYSQGEEVVLWMSSVGPYQNQQERYAYFSLPFCRGPLSSVSHEHETLGEALLGTEMEFSGLDIGFRVHKASSEYCASEPLDKSQTKALAYAVKNLYAYSMYLDDLPIVGIVGDVEGDNSFVWTHKKIEIGYNGNQIIDVNFTSENRVPLREGVVLHFTYEVIWKESNVDFDDRFDRYLDPNFFQHRIHWFSIFNSFMMVIFLMGLVSLILLRTLRKDLARYSREDDLDEMERDLGDEYGWKQVHGDVFRAPPSPLLFSSLVGSGIQTGASVLAMISLATFLKMDSERGSLLSSCIFIYSTLSPLNGLSGGALYARLGGKSWISQVLVSSLLLPGSVIAVSLTVNSLSLSIHSSRSIPFLSMLAVLAIITFIILPLNLLGSILGRALAGSPDYPCRVNAVPRPIPGKKWFMEPGVICCLGGLLPFGSIFIEMYFVLTSFWAYKYYYVYGFMLLVFFILMIVTTCVTIVCSYFLLNAEDYRWQWTSFFAGASTAVYLYLYSIYFFFFKTKMFGLFQTVFYFGYMGLFCAVLGVMTGSMGYIGSSFFVKKIYSNVKID